jgi:ADP-ribose pyrophosphatase
MNPDDTRTEFAGNQIQVVVERWGDAEREIVRHPGAVAIVAVDTQDEVTLVRQPREPVRKRLLELPAGTLEEREEPIETARRELEEETGLHGGEWRELTRFYSSPGWADEVVYVFVAERLERGEPDPDGTEEIELVRIPLVELPSKLAEIDDAKTLAGLLLYLRA